MSQQFFKDLKVVELSSILAGPAVGMFFAELGAQVIKIENKPHGGDLTRKWKLPEEDKTSPVSAYFSSVNYGKLHHMVDLSVTEEYKKVLELIQGADVVIVNFKKGDAEKFGFTWAQLTAMNPKLIYAHLTGYGPESEKTAFDVVLQAETGFMSMNGTTESGPVKMPVALIDILAAHQLKEGILVALLNRNETGKGAYVHTTLYQSAVASLANQASNYLMTGHVPQPMGTLHPNIAPYGELVEVNNGAKYVLAIGSDKQFHDLCTIVGLNAMALDEKFATNSMRVKNRLELHAALTKAVLAMDEKIFADQTLQKHVPVGKLNTLKEVFVNPVAQEMVRHENIEGVETKRVTSIAFSISFNV